MKSLLVYKKHEKQSHAKRQGVLVLLNRAVKTGGPALNGPALTDFGPGQKVRLKNGLEIYYPSPALHGPRANGPARIKNYIFYI